jgi:DNA transformation protein
MDDQVRELFAAFGPVTVRRMFGGAGIFSDGLMIGLVHDGIIYLKGDETTIPAFQRENLGPFSYDTKDGKRSLTSYWRMPERLYDDPDELARWARQALETARRKERRPKPSGKNKPT